MDIRWLSLFTCALGILFASSTALALSTYRADLAATRFGAIDVKLTGKIEFSVNDDQDQWTFRLSAKGGPIKSIETSHGTIEGNQFLPQSYLRESKVLFIKETLSWEFDWPNNRVAGRYKKDSMTHTNIEALNDPVSFQFPMRQALNNNETALQYRFLKHKNPSTVEFEVIGEELVTIGNKDIHTKIIKQLRPLKKDEQKYLWVASEYDHIPVRYRTFEKDKLKEEINVERLWVDDQDISQ